MAAPAFWGSSWMKTARPWNTPLRQLNELFSSLVAIVVGVRREGRLFVPGPQ